MRTFFFGFLPFLIFSSFFRWYYVCKISNQCNDNTSEPIEIVEKQKRSETPVQIFTQNDFHVDGSDLEITQDFVDYIKGLNTDDASMLEVIISGNTDNKEAGTQLGEDVKSYMIEEEEMKRPINVIYNASNKHTGNTMQIIIKEY